LYRELELQVNQKIRLFKIKYGGCLLWYKLSAEIPHCQVLLKLTSLSLAELDLMQHDYIYRSLT